MLYRDSPTIEVTLTVPATPHDVWSLVTDIGFPVRHSTELQAVQWLGDSDGVRVGARFRGTSSHPATGEWSTECLVTEVDPPRRWVWQVCGSDDDPVATWAFEVEPARDGVLVRQWARMGPGPSGLTPAIRASPEKEARIVARRLEQWRTSMTANLEGLRQDLQRS
ncbi:SRPBCC family protein [Dermatophilaceae bacterium Soc4.6]